MRSGSINANGRTWFARDGLGESEVEELLELSGQRDLVSGCEFAVLYEGNLPIAYTAYRSNAPIGWDYENVASYVVPELRSSGLFQALISWWIADMDGDTTICTYADDPAAQHVVEMYWRPHVAKGCDNGSVFYGTRVKQVG